MPLTQTSHPVDTFTEVFTHTQVQTCICSSIIYNGRKLETTRFPSTEGSLNALGCIHQMGSFAGKTNTRQLHRYRRGILNLFLVLQSFCVIMFMSSKVRFNKAVTHLKLERGMVNSDRKARIFTQECSSSCSPSHPAIRTRIPV